MITKNLNKESEVVCVKWSGGRIAPGEICSINVYSRVAAKRYITVFDVSYYTNKFRKLYKNEIKLIKG